MLKLRDLPLGIYEKSVCFNMSWEDKFKLIKDSGYDYFEIAIDGSEERLNRMYCREEMLRIRRASESIDTPLYTMAFTANRFYPLGSEDTQVREKGIELLKKCIDFAAYVGIKVIHIAAYDEVARPRNMMTAAYFRQSVEKCIEHAAIRGVIIAFESMDSDFMDNTKKIMSYVRSFDSAYLQAVADIGNITSMGGDPSIDMPIGGKHLVAIHIKDTLPGQVRDVFFGTGNVDFDRSFRTLSDMKYQGFMVAEMWCHDDPAYHPNIKKACEFLKRNMKDY